MSVNLKKATIPQATVREITPEHLMTEEQADAMYKTERPLSNVIVSSKNAREITVKHIKSEPAPPAKTGIPASGQYEETKWDKISPILSILIPFLIAVIFTVISMNYTMIVNMISNANNRDYLLDAREYVIPVSNVITTLCCFMSSYRLIKYYITK